METLQLLEQVEVMDVKNPAEMSECKTKQAYSQTSACYGRTTVLPQYTWMQASRPCHNPAVEQEEASDTRLHRSHVLWNMGGFSLQD